MATKLARVLQKVFGSTAGPTDLGVIGSLAAGSPAFTDDPLEMQSLPNFDEGWFGVVVGANSPAIEDMNSLCFLLSRQIAYVLQTGVPEWDATTSYFIGSIAQDGTGVMYVSLTDNNLNHALTSTANWRSVSGGTNLVTVTPPTAYTLSLPDNGKTFLVNSAAGAIQFNLPVPSANFKFKIKDSGGVMNTNGCTMHRNAAELFAGLATDYVMNANGGEWEIGTDGTNWFILGR